MEKNAFCIQCCQEFEGRFLDCECICSYCWFENIISYARDSEKDELIYELRMKLKDLSDTWQWFQKYHLKKAEESFKKPNTKVKKNEKQNT